MRGSTGIVALLALGLARCGGTPEETPSGVAPHVRVQVAPVRRDDIAATLEAPGEVEATVVLRLASPVAGRITFLTLRPGDHAAKGETVARVVPLETEATLHGFALLEGSGGHEHVRRPGTEDTGVALEAAFDALVSDRARNPGEQVAAGDVLLELFDPATVDVLVQVPLAGSARVHPGLPVTGASCTGHVAALVPALTQPGLTVGVRVALAAAPVGPLLHAPVRCAIELERHAGALLVPRAALLALDASGQGVVLVVADGIATRRAVRAGLRTERDVEIEDGLAEGELVVTDGGYGLPDRTRVETAGASP